ncbi:MAG: hypothetical protein WBL21_02800, partial [Salinimicrobium sp.]
MKKIILLLLLMGVTLMRSQQNSGYDDGAELYQLRNYESMRISSYDRSGANDDGNWKDKIKPGETRTIGEVDGPGIIKHIWFTIASGEENHLKKIVLRMYWDDEKTPS